MAERVPVTEAWDIVCAALAPLEGTLEDLGHRNAASWVDYLVSLQTLAGRAKQDGIVLEDRKFHSLILHLKSIKADEYASIVTDCRAVLRAIYNSADGTVQESILTALRGMPPPPKAASVSSEGADLLQYNITGKRECARCHHAEHADTSNLSVPGVCNSRTRYTSEALEKQVCGCPGPEPFVHDLKIWPKPFEAVLSGEKTYEVRKADRPFKVNDILMLMEWDPERKAYTGREVQRRISHITAGGGWGIPHGLCVLGIQPLQAQAVPNAGSTFTGERPVYIDHAKSPQEGAPGSSGR